MDKIRTVGKKIVAILGKIWNFIRTNFLTWKFISFGLIGVVNTGIDLLVYGFFMNNLHFEDWTWAIEGWRPGTFFAGAIAFIVASIFSYFANAFLTFRPKQKTASQFSAVMAVFLIRLLITSGLTTVFDFLTYKIVMGYDGTGWVSFVPRFFASALLIPIAYFALDFVFKKTGTKNDKNPVKDSNQPDNIVK